MSDDSLAPTQASTQVVSAAECVRSTDSGIGRTVESEQETTMKPYSGAPKLNQLPATKENYKAKNMSGGRKAVFSQSKDYKRQGNSRFRKKGLLVSGITRIATPWYGWEA